MDNKLEIYIEKHSSDEPDYLKDLNKETNTRYLNPRMIAGHVQGRLLSILTKMVAPKNILEIGTYTGYSTLCFAEGLPKDGIIHTIEKNDELADIANRYFVISGLNEKIKYHSGDALKIIPTLNIRFDLVYIDGEKKEYPEYLHIVKPLINKGGYLIADNVFWNDKIFSENEQFDQTTQAILQFNDLIAKDKDFEKLFLPVRDGLMISRKI
jgi:caffeoyl-CoA O-methyltransferase